MICSVCGKENREGARFCDECGTGLRPVDGQDALVEDFQGVESGFVGRQREMGQLLDTLEEAIGGRGRLVMLAGEPGIGKTRLAQEVSDRAEAQGAQVLWGRCYEEGGTPPYWPWTQIVRTYLRQVSPEQLRAELGPGAADIAEVINELGEQFPGLEPRHDMDQDQARFRLFNSLTTFLKNAALARPKVLVLEDLHWADTSSLALLEFVAREISDINLLVIATYRDIELSRQHPLSRTLGGLAREQLYQRIPLRGLDLRELELLVQSTVGMAPPKNLAQSLQLHTEGNPFFAIEVIRLLEREGDLASRGNDQPESWEIRIPEGVREVIGRRLDSLSEECNQALTLASIIGREFTLFQVKALFDDLTEDRLLEAFEEALQARVIEESPQAVARYQFTHALIQETLAGELSLTRRVRLHAQIAQALEKMYGEDSAGHAAELAYHFAEAQTVVAPEKLVRYSRIAGEQALAAYAWEEAQKHFEMGLAGRGISPASHDPLTDDEAAALIFGFGRARIGTAERLQMQEVVDCLARAFDYYVDSGNVDSALAVAVSDHHVPVASIHSGMTRIIKQALELVVPGSLEEGRLQARYGVELGRVERDYAAAQEAFERALAIARDARHAELELTALTGAADVDFFHLRLEDCLTKSLMAIKLATSENDIYGEVVARLNAMRPLVFMGDSEAAHSQGAALLSSAERLQDRYLLGFAYQHNSNLASLQGDWSTSRTLSGEGLALSDQDFNNLSILAMLEFEIGHFDQGEAYLERLLRVKEQTPLGPRMSYACVAMGIPYADRISGMGRKLEEAEDAARVVISFPSPYPMFAGPARCGLGLRAIAKGDTTGAAEQYAELEIIKGVMVHQHMVGDRMLGLLAHTVGDLEVAVDHFEDSLSFCRKAGYRPELAWTCCDYADTLLQRNEPEDLGKATSLLEESLAISTELGMLPLMERVQSRLESPGSSPITEPAYPHGLTQREVEVLRLIAQGKSNRDIGDELVITEATVRRHVSNIYDKIGVSNRAEATRYALREGLVHEG